jgi:hypothetical protein
MFNMEQAIADWRRQMLAAGIKTPVPLEELEGHLRAEIEQQIKFGSNEQDALNSAVQKIGQPQAIEKEFAKAAETNSHTMINHNRLYSTILAILAVFNANMAIQLIISQIRLHNLENLVGGQYLRFQEEQYVRFHRLSSHPWMTAIISAYTVAMAVTFFARRYHPNIGRRLTRLLNWTLLPMLLVGTVFGLYGLWKVDKEKAQYV